MYSFDPVGSYEREACRAAGAAQSLVQPFLDNQASHTSNAHDRASSTIPTLRHVTLEANRNLSQVYFKNQSEVHGESFPSHLPLTSVLKLIVDAFTSATERHIEVRGFFAGKNAAHIVGRLAMGWRYTWRWSATARVFRHFKGCRECRR